MQHGSKLLSINCLEEVHLSLNMKNALDFQASQNGQTKKNTAETILNVF